MKCIIDCLCCSEHFCGKIGQNGFFSCSIQKFNAAVQSIAFIVISSIENGLVLIRTFTEVLRLSHLTYCAVGHGTMGVLVIPSIMFIECNSS